MGSWKRNISLLCGPIAGYFTYAILPEHYFDLTGTSLEFSHAGRATIAVLVWMAIWWLTEVIDVAATALLPIVLFPLLGIADIKTTTTGYASDLIFLFLGSFIIALAMQRWGLDRRIALLTLRFAGTQPARMVAGFMVVTAFLSAFVSNTATTAMMLPVALSVIDLVMRNNSHQALADTTLLPDFAGRNFALCLLLGVAYAASIGGAATIIGTPPNLYLVSFINNSIAAPYRQDISFLSWLVIGVPIALTLLPLTWFLLVRVLYRIQINHIPGGQQLLREQYHQLGPISNAERITLLVFIFMASAWIIRPYIPISGLSDTGIALIAALALFIIPTGTHDRIMDWQYAKRLPWGILILFGGGLTLASAVSNHGVADFIGAQTTTFSHWPPFLILLVVVATVIFLTELTSNTATTATLIPILAALAPSLGLHPYLLIIPATVAASCAFMMPVATPPNAIVFGSGHITVAEMCHAGFWLNIIGAILLPSLSYAIIIYTFI